MTARKSRQSHVVWHVYRDPVVDCYRVSARSEPYEKCSLDERKQYWRSIFKPTWKNMGMKALRKGQTAVITLCVTIKRVRSK